MNLKYIVAKIAFGTVHADEIRAVVDSLLTEGTYSDDFIDIMDSKPARLDEVLPPFTSFLKAKMISIPSKDQAVWQIIEYHVSRIATEVADTFEELNALIYDVYWDYDFHSQTKSYLGDSHGIEHLIGLYWEHDEIPEGSKEIGALKKKVISRSLEWMGRFANHAFHMDGDSAALHPRQ